ncbi:MAG: hypothetical protein IKO65_02750 [Victivallales bacterium]|nr:hypothetical protein [Victivallales bacterium]
MAPKSFASERVAVLRRRKLRWILENGGGRRRRFRHRGQTQQWLPQTLLVLMLALAVLGVAYEFFC